MMLTRGSLLSRTRGLLTAHKAFSTAANEYVLEFGKHRGSRLDEVPDDYIQWILRKGIHQEKPSLAMALRAAGHELPVVQQQPWQRNGGGQRQWGAQKQWGGGNQRFGNNQRFGGGSFPPKPKINHEAEWRNVESDPEEWVDQRTTKKHEKQPDFKHKSKDVALWLDSKTTPEWAKEKFGLE